MTDHLTLGDGVGRAALLGALVGFVAMAIAATAIARLAGVAPLDAVGLGAMVGVWSGPGFGSLFGAILAFTRNEVTAAAAAVTDVAS